MKIKVSIVLIVLNLYSMEQKQKLSTPPSKNVSIFKEIAVGYAQNIHEHYNSLSTEEKIFAYYMLRASIPGNSIAAEQLHRHAREIIKLFELIYSSKEKVSNKEFIEDVKVYLIYLWANHSQYFGVESNLNKRTPKVLGLKALSPENLLIALNELGLTNAQDIVYKLDGSIFNVEIEPTLCVSGSIEESAVNFYSPDFSEQDYQAIAPDLRSKINAYFHKNRGGEICVDAYSAEGKCGEEITMSIYWISKAYEYIQKHPDYFDPYLVESLESLIKFFVSGDEIWFRKHSMSWLKSNSKIDYTFGFIESYDDPKSVRSLFASEVTIKTIDIKKLSTILPNIESSLPFDPLFKRDRFDIPNASINVQLFGTGDYGPLKLTLAYCLPNYEDIRSEYGSKQIIYQTEQGLGSLLNPELNLELSYTKSDLEWIRENDPKLKAISTIDTLLTILHETIGHASGKLDKHVFVKNDLLNIENHTYSPGEVIGVTSTNLSEFLQGYDQTIEELRAEIIALYVAVNHLEEILSTGIVDELKLFEEQDLKKLLILVMAQSGFKRLGRQPEGSNIISGDHARANSTITNYLLEKNCIKEIREEKVIDGVSYTVPGLKIVDLEIALETVKELMILVQTIKSTGNGIGAKNLIDNYGTIIKDLTLPELIKSNKKAVVGDIKATVLIYPHMTPVYDDNNNVIDIIPSWPKDIFEQRFYYSKAALSKE